MKSIALLGSTGSIGTQVLDVVSRLPDRLRVVSMAAHRNVELFAEQVRRFRPEVVSIGSEEDAERLRKLVGSDCPHPGASRDARECRQSDTSGAARDARECRQSDTSGAARDARECHQSDTSGASRDARECRQSDTDPLPLQLRARERGHVGLSHDVSPSPQPSPSEGEGAGGSVPLAIDHRPSAIPRNEHPTPPWSPEILWGDEGLRRVATHPEADVTVVSVAGAVGLSPTLAAISAGKDIALASKEVLVAAGSLVTKMVADRGTKLLPIDSEHSAIFQCLQGQQGNKIGRLMLTASGGSFANYPLDGLEDVTIDQALAHPTWSMGRKITIDSATMMNKALEIIEARWLFGVDPALIEVVIHPQSIVHSMVEFVDGSVLAQMGIPDMRLPIQYALLYPERVDTGLPRLDIAAQGQLTFAKPDPMRYPGLELAYRALEQGGTMPAVLNAANEVAVTRFLDGRIKFQDIVRTVRRIMDEHTPVRDPDLEQILAADFLAREAAQQ